MRRWDLWCYFFIDSKNFPQVSAAIDTLMNYVNFILFFTFWMFICYFVIVTTITIDAKVIFHACLFQSFFVTFSFGAALNLRSLLFEAAPFLTQTSSGNFLRENFHCKDSFKISFHNRWTVTSSISKLSSLDKKVITKWSSEGSIFARKILANSNTVDPYLYSKILHHGSHYLTMF